MPSPEHPVINSLVDGYERHAEPLTADIVRRAFDFFRPALSDKRTIDVGAGTGAFAIIAAEAGAKVVAIDYSADMVARLGQRLAPFPGCEALRMDGQALLFADASFDVAASIFGIITFPDWRKGLREMVRVTRPGGKLIVATWPGSDGAGPAAIGVQAARELLDDERGGGPGVLGSASELVAQLRQAGCADVQIHRVETLWGGGALDDTRTALEEALAFTPFYGRLDADTRIRMREPMTRLLAQYEGADGMVRVPVTAHVAMATVAA